MATTTALLNGATSIRDQLATYQDSVMAYQFGNSAYTDSALSEYSAYLQDRIKTLSTGGSISNASKALSLTKALDSATKSNISATITRENIQMMAGGASLTDKYNVISTQYMRAQANGDLTLAQTLMSQAYSVNQSIQLQAQQAADAATTLAKANAASIGGDVSSLKESLAQLNNDIKQTGSKQFDSTVSAWTKTNSAALEALGVKLPNQPNYFDIVHGVAGAIINHDSLAAKAYAPYDPGKASTFAADAYNMANGIDKLGTLGGNLTIPQILQASANPNQFVYNPSEGKFVQTQVIGHQMAQQYDINGNPTGFALQPVYSGQLGDTTFRTGAVNPSTGLPQKPGVDTGIHTAVLTPAQTSTISALGLKFDTNNKTKVGESGVAVSATQDSPAWIKNILGDSGATNLFSTAQGLQFTFNSKNGTGLSSYTIISDKTGKLGVAEEANTGSYILNGQYGFNPSNLDTATKSHGNFLGALTGGLTSIFGGHASAESLLQNATGNYASPIPMAQTPLPSISLPPIQPLPSISTTPTPAAASVIPHTVSVQNAAGNIQGSNVGNIQSGGKGIPITGTTNANVGFGNFNL